jgi:stage V sporulation protein G
MNITDVRVRKVTKEGKMKAVVSITIDDEFVVHDIKVIEGEKGLFIAMPSRKATDGEYRDIAHPINSKTRNEIQEIILQKYEETLAAEEAEDDSKPEPAEAAENAPAAEEPGEVPAE